LHAVRTAAEADLVVLNTCTVTASADADARHAVRKLHREQPDSKILVTGCYAQRSPGEIAALDGVTWVIGNSHKTSVAEIVLDSPSFLQYHGQIFASDMTNARDFLAAPVVDAYSDRSRPTLKVQDGCSNKCSFCIIPSVRGRSRSATLQSVVQQVQDLSTRYAEVVLSGINLGRWGRDLPGSSRFIDLLQAVLRETDVRRLRISSVEPMDWSADVLELVGSEPRIAKHVHMPLQSGSDAVLKRMFRKYRVRHYASRLDLACALVPDCAIGADVMTGFPGETDEQFAETVRFIEEQPFTYLHVFTYSERPGTAAAAEPDQVPVSLRRERTHILRTLSESKNLAFRKQMVGRSLPAVILSPARALTTNYLQVELTRAHPQNETVDIQIGGLAPAGLRELQLFQVLPAATA
jgi:threonylcarbamoyladenosine tRNA methylthiotransferase MtaB